MNTRMETYQEVSFPRSRPVGFRWSRILGVILCTAVLLAGWGKGALGALLLDPVATGLASPVGITNAGDGSGRLFIVLQGGKIRVLKGATLLPTPFLDISKKVSCCGERGLLGLAFHPDYKSNGVFFVNYTNRAGNTIIARFTVSGNPDVANPASRKTILTVKQPFANHNGGQLQFGHDGFLYIGMGDGGSGGDPLNNAQSLRSLLGKILRIDVNRSSRYGIPGDNPFVGQVQVRPEIWALGLRNPWRFSFDRATGDLLIGDVGQGSFEEVDFHPANTPGGVNYGWRLMEGNHCFNPASDCNDGTLTLPIIEYDHSLGCAVIGGYVYRGNLIASLSGTYLYGDFCSGRIWGATPSAGGQWTSTELMDTGDLISAFGEDENGELYFSGLNTGTVYHIAGLL